MMNSCSYIFLNKGLFGLNIEKTLESYLRKVCSTFIAFWQNVKFSFKLMILMVAARNDSVTLVGLPFGSLFLPSASWKKCDCILSLCVFEARARAKLVTLYTNSLS